MFIKISLIWLVTLQSMKSSNTARDEEIIRSQQPVRDFSHLKGFPIIVKYHPSKTAVRRIVERDYHNRNMWQVMAIWDKEIEIQNIFDRSTPPRFVKKTETNFDHIVTKLRAANVFHLEPNTAQRHQDPASLL